MKTKAVEWATGVLALVFSVLLRVSGPLKLESLARIVRLTRWRERLGSLDGRGSGITASAVSKDPPLVTIGDRSFPADFVRIWRGGVVVGNDVLVASHCAINSLTHSTRCLLRGSLVRRRVIIEDNVWVGVGAVILPSVTVGRGSIVGAGAVIARDLAAGEIVVGGTARPIYVQVSRT